MNDNQTEQGCENPQSLANIASELFRFRGVFTSAIDKLELEERTKYLRQFAYFSKTVTKALEEHGITMRDFAGQEYDPGMAVTPLNIDEFSSDDRLYIAQTIEPVVMHRDNICKTGTVILGKAEK